MSDTKTNASCPNCGGTGKLLIIFRPGFIPCDVCNGTGEVDAEFEARARRGSYCRAARINNEIGLRDFAKKNALPVGNVSRFERGIKMTDEEEKAVQAAYDDLMLR